MGFNIHFLMQNANYFNFIFGNKAIENEVLAYFIFVITGTYVIYFSAMPGVFRYFMKSTVHHFQIDITLTLAPVFLSIYGNTF